MAYAVMMKNPEFHPIELTLKGAMTIPSDSRLFFLRKTEREFIVWDNSQQKIIWIGMSEVRSAAIMRKVTIFQATTKRNKEDGKND